ncbi:DUF262 domain-containing protein [Leyella stercorea]|uniref:DUF262 domain-containing protein n=1 Tax=Leyella stercorea TaxID=363265 RepID=UPI0024311F6F|nr:DUF262 domain-containing protein [Leyella stercorea]
MINSRKYTLIDLFKATDNEEESQYLPLNNIEVPIIQRDYAQGRNQPEVNRIRARFLDALYIALTTLKPITLDFVYGEINDKKTLIPLDGQQRLTTLFLLHWYIARHECVEEERLGFLSKFSYATRYSAREFCKQLVANTYTPNFNTDVLSHDITDQNWMPRDWQNDPTIGAMLNMLDDIHRKFNKTDGLWQRLEEGCVSFYFLSIKQLGATDELYIKMNSRGKPLTEFEHFKAEWEGNIKEIEPKLTEEQKNNEEKTLSQTIGHKIDVAWTDLLWPYRNSETGTATDDIIDDEFVRYFRFLADIIYCKNGAPLNSSNDIFTITKELFGSNNPSAIENVKTIERGFDCWLNIDIESIFDSVLTTHTTDKPRKCIVDEPVNIFVEACHNNGDIISGHRRKFPLGRTVLLYAFVYYLQHKDTIEEAQFARRIRMVSNLIKGSEYELRENNLANLIRQTEYVLDNGDIEEGYLSFNANQLIEEHEKVEWLKNNPEKEDVLCKLENHNLLQGAVRVVGLENIDLTDRFYSLFECDWALVNRALLTIGDYSQLVSWRYQIGSANNESSWKSIFKTNKEDLKETKRILIELLSRSNKFTDDVLNNIIDDYLKSTSEYDWRHYLIKYASMRPERYGMYYWEDFRESQKASYSILMMWTEKSISGRNHNIFLKALYEKTKAYYPDLSIYLGDYAYSGNGSVLELTFADKYLYFTDDKLYVYHAITNELGESQETVDIVKEIPQNEHGVDTADRVELAFSVVESLINK